MMKQRYCICVLCSLLGLAVLLGLLLVRPASLHAQQPATKAAVSFINDVAPILKENCFACHDSKKRKGKLDMTTYENFRKGGAHEDPIAAGKPDESHILDLLIATDKTRMPPKESGDALAADKIAIIKQWIIEGAKLDTGLSPKADLLRELRARWTPPAPPTGYPYPVTITALTFTPDGKKLVVGGHHELSVWDAAQGTLVMRLMTRSERAYGMVFLPDGKLAVAGGRPGQEGDVRVYDLQGGKPRVEKGIAVLDGIRDKGAMVRHLLEADDSVLCVAVSPDGKKLASGGCDRVVNVWDISSGVANAKLEQSIENHADWVFGVAFAPDNKHLLTCSRDKTAKVWDLATKESVLTFPDHQNTVYGVVARPTGQVGVSVGSDNQLRLWNATGEGKQIRAAGGHAGEVYRLLHHPKLPLVVSCGADKTVRLWNPDTGQNTRTLSGHTDYVYALALSPDGNLVASGSWNGEVKIWKLADGGLVKDFNATPFLTRPVSSTK